MNKHFKEVLVMNLIYNLLLAVILSVVAQLLSFGTVAWPAVLRDILIAYILEMVIALFLPFSKWGFCLLINFRIPERLSTDY